MAFNEDSSASGHDEPWIQWFCGLKGHEMFCEVERSYIEDGFNLYGLRACVSNFSDCLDLILDRIGPDDSDDSHLTQSACTLYGLIHARYIITAHGLDAMYNKYAAKEFGTCPLIQCAGQPVLPVGLKDEMGADTVKIFCPKCNQVYHTPPIRSRTGHSSGVDGAAFGTTFPHLFLMTFSNLVPDPLPLEATYVPRVFGFRLHKSARQRNTSAGAPAIAAPTASAAAAAAAVAAAAAAASTSVATGTTATTVAAATPNAAADPSRTTAPGVAGPAAQPTTTATRAIATKSTSKDSRDFDDDDDSGKSATLTDGVNTGTVKTANADTAALPPPAPPAAASTSRPADNGMVMVSATGAATGAGPSVPNPPQQQGFDLGEEDDDTKQDLVPKQPQAPQQHSTAGSALAVAAGGTADTRPRVRAGKRRKEVGSSASAEIGNKRVDGNGTAMVAPAAGAGGGSVGVPTFLMENPIKRRRKNSNNGNS